MSTPRLPGPWPASLTTRKCRKPDTCEHAGSWHTHHLTWLGRWKYAGETPVYLRFPRVHQVVFVVLTLLVAWSIFNMVIAPDWTERVLQGVCALVDAGCAWLWWSWGVREAKRRDRHAALVQRIRGGDLS